MNKTMEDMKVPKQKNSMRTTPARLRRKAIALATLLLATACSKDSEPLSDAKEPTAITLSIGSGDGAMEVGWTIDRENRTFSATVPFGTDLSALAPEIAVPEGADYAPKGARDLSYPIKYIITAEDGSKLVYTAVVSVAANTALEILSLMFTAADNDALDANVASVIGQGTDNIDATVPFGTDVTALLPKVGLPEQATLSPEGPQDFTSPVAYTVTAGDGSTKDYTVGVSVGQSSQNDILSFAFAAADNDALASDFDASVDNQNATVTVTVPFGTDVTALLPTLGVSQGADYAPKGSRDFSSPVQYTVTAGDGSTKAYTVGVSVGLGTGKDILSLAFAAADNQTLDADVAAVIDQGTNNIDATVPFGTDVTALLPKVGLPEQANLSPEGPQDFSSPVAYTVTAGDGSTRTYTVGVSVAQSSQNDILSLAFAAADNQALDADVAAVIDQGTNNIDATVPFGTDVTALLPKVGLPEQASLSPEGPQDFTSPVAYTVTAGDGSTRTYTVGVLVGKSSQNDILSLAFAAADNQGLDADVAAVIDQGTNNIDATVPFGTDVTALLPKVVLPEQANLSPEGPQDFTSPVAYTVTAGDGSTRTYTVGVSVGKSSQNDILSLAFAAADNQGLDADVAAVIDQGTNNIDATVPFGTDVTALFPAVGLPEQATLSPEGPQDFSSPVAYTVTAGDGSTKAYTVNVSVTAPSDRKNILSFSFAAADNEVLASDIDARVDNQNATVTATVPFGTDVTALLPTVGLPEQATHSPEGPQDFSSPVAYTVTAGDGSTKAYTVNVSVTAPSDREVLFELYNANPGNTFGWDLNDPDIATWQGVTTDDQGRVTKLNLNDRKISHLPASIGNLDKLIRLDLNTNALTEIPKELGNLNNLTTLYLFNNALTEIPKELGNLNNLELLYLRNNALTEIPPELGNLTNLTVLYLIFNILTEIPQEVCALQETGTTIIKGDKVSCASDN
jgi:sulfopyruvate decarboxylase TPP-binding subunit